MSCSQEGAAPRKMRGRGQLMGGSFVWQDLGLLVGERSAVDMECPCSCSLGCISIASKSRKIILLCFEAASCSRVQLRTPQCKKGIEI